MKEKKTKIREISEKELGVTEVSFDNHCPKIVLHIYEWELSWVTVLLSIEVLMAPLQRWILFSFQLKLEGISASSPE